MTKNLDEIQEAIHEVLNEYVSTEDIDDSNHISYIVGGIRVRRGCDWRTAGEDGRRALIAEIAGDIIKKLEED